MLFIYKNCKANEPVKNKVISIDLMLAVVIKFTLSCLGVIRRIGLF